ncbi:unnamed protein product [Peronospora belbahrii]|uniref:CCZ1/INTU/HSP4 first Longin domain-containing protein n=1 Tax=Peronospora belbahrii TaxID=622444 RepID=A0AAU9LCY8_9STRA|nr:unnamed protein product [Peronospora belbahrii]
MLLLWHEALGTDDEQATEDELYARIIYSYEDSQDARMLLQSLHFVQGLLAFVRALERSKDLTEGVATTEWTPQWTSVTLTRRRFFILEVEPQIFMALGIQPIVEIARKDHRAGYEALLRDIYGMFRLFHGTIESNLRLLPSVDGSNESDMTFKKDTDGMDLLMNIAAVRKRLRKLRLAIDLITHHMPRDVYNDGKECDNEMAQLQDEKQTTEAELRALVALSPATTLQKKCSEFFPTLLQSLNVRSVSAMSELQGLSYFPMDQLTFLSLQTFVNGFHTDIRLSESGVEVERVENMALFFKGNLLWNSLETTTMHLLYKFLQLREERGMTMLRGDDEHGCGDVKSALTPSNDADAELWMTNPYQDTFLPVWSSKLSYTECDVIAQSKNGRPPVRMAARSLHKQHPASLSTFLSEALPSSGGGKLLAPVLTPPSSVGTEPSQCCPPPHSPTSLTRHIGARRSETSSANFHGAVKNRARTPSFRNAGLMLHNGCFSKLLHPNREIQSGRGWSGIERVWSPLVYPLHGVSPSIATAARKVMAARHRVVVWHEADLTMILLLHLNETKHDSTSAAPTKLQASTIERLEDYLEGQQRFQTLAKFILTRYNATFASKKKHVPRLLKSKEDDLFPVPGKLLVHYFPASATSLINKLHAELHQSFSTGNREICVRTRHAGWVLAKKSETSHRELYVFIDSKMGSTLYDLADSLQMLLDDQFGNVLF